MTSLHPIPHKPASHPTFGEVVRVFARIGCLSFGGPAGQIALMHSEIVDRHKWVGEEEYLHALNFCHLLPGPEAQQLATWIGWKLYGIRGGMAAGLLFVLPGALIILGLSWLYAIAAGTDWIAAIFIGVKAAVIAIIAQALLRIAGRSLNTPFKKFLALAGFAGLFFLNLPFPVVILLSLVIGATVAALNPRWLKLDMTVSPSPATPLPWGRSIRTVAIWAGAWAVPFVLVALMLGRDHVLWDIASFFSQLAIVTFGGAYAVLAYMAQEAVQGYGWLSAGEMVDGLGLAEPTPGPLILVTQFVGFLAAYRSAAPFDPLVAGLLGAVITTWVTFVPCFLWIFTLSPWIERLENIRVLKGGLSALTAVVVGVIANLALWFALHVLFADVAEEWVGPIRLFIPDWISFDWRAGLLALLAALALLRFRVNVPTVLGLAALGGWLIGMS